MSHALALPASPLAPPLRVPLPFHADPVLAAIERHEEAYAAFWTAPDGEAAERALSDYDAARTALLGTACATREGAFCLLRHLRWWLGEETSNAGLYGEAWAVAQARESDLTLFLGCEAVRRIPLALPLGRLAPTPMPRTTNASLIPASTLARVGRALSATGEAAAALAIVLGGCGLIGLASLI